MTFSSTDWAGEWDGGGVLRPGGARGPGEVLLARARKLTCVGHGGRPRAAHGSAPLDTLGPGIGSCGGGGGVQVVWLGLGGGGRLELALDLASVATAEDLGKILCGNFL